MWVSIVPNPKVPLYTIHQFLWAYFPDVPVGDPRPFLYRMAGREIIMLSRIRPACPAVFVADKLQSGRAYQFSGLINAIRRFQVTGEKRHRDRAIEGNDDRREWFIAKTRGADVGFVQFYDRHWVSFKKGDGARVKYLPFEAKGVLYVTDRAEFMEWLYKGPGRAKCWGCGLILLPEIMKSALRIAA